jgi:hypothetical protein
MRRGYTREGSVRFLMPFITKLNFFYGRLLIFSIYIIPAYLDLVTHVRETIPNVSLSSDFICGFCGETDEEFADTLSLINTVKYNVAFLFAYSMREV